MGGGAWHAESGTRRQSSSNPTAPSRISRPADPGEDVGLHPSRGKSPKERRLELRAKFLERVVAHQQLAGKQGVRADKARGNIKVYWQLLVQVVLDGPEAMRYAWSGEMMRELGLGRAHRGGRHQEGGGRAESKATWGL